MHRLGRLPAVRLPDDYVRDHVELGYALTVHRAQGSTADTAHMLAGPGMSREALYVGLTRGRHANYAYVATDARGPETHVAEDGPTGRQILEAVLRSPASEASATSTLRRCQADRVLELARAGRRPPPPAAEAIRSRSSTAPDPPPPTPGLTR